MWDEFADRGLDLGDPAALERHLSEWEEVVERDANHPAVVGWCPFNETQADQRDGTIRTVYRTTKRLDPTRPVLDASGWNHVETDVLDTHDYDQDPEAFRERYDRIRRGETVEFDHHFIQNEYGSCTSFVSEYGGTLWAPDGDEGLTSALLENPTISAFCYTQLYDIEQERNGLYTYDREPKFDAETLRQIFEASATIGE